MSAEYLKLVPLMSGLSRVIQALMEFAKAAGCYKVILDCGESNVAFYEKCGLTRKEVQMVSVPRAPARSFSPEHRCCVPLQSARCLSEAGPCCRCLRK